MPVRGDGRAPSVASWALAAALMAATLALSWFGYRATREWEQNAALLVQRRGSEVLALLIAALNKDMKGAQVSLLTPLNAELLAPDPPHDLREMCARMFARFPYPESCFLWFADAPATERNVLKS